MSRISMEIFDKIYASENIKDISKIVELNLFVLYSGALSQRKHQYLPFQTGQNDLQVM